MNPSLLTEPRSHVHRHRRYDAHVSGLEAVTSDPVAERFAAGDDAALREAYAEHGPVIYSPCRRKLDEDRAKDATQEVVVSAWKSRERFDPARGSLAAWLVGIAKNRIVDAIRSEQRHASRRADVDVTDTAVAPDVDRVGDRMLVSQALASLPDRARHVIELAYLKDMTHAQIVDETGLPLGTVKSDIRRGLTRIRTHLEGSDV